MRKRVLSAILLAAVYATAQAATYVVEVDAGVEEHAVTKMAMGSGLVYSWYADSMFADGEAAHIIKDIGLGALRWPGGAVTTFFHWGNLNGQGWLDNWDPSYNHTLDQPPENYMDLDEYLALIDETGAEIMLGINMSSGKEWNREADSITEASNLVSYCQSKGYDVKYIYFDNENYQGGNNYNRDDDGDGEVWTASSYADSFNLYAAAVKTVYPAAKLIANWKNNVTGPVVQGELSDMLSIAGHNIDFMDFHYYWQWDNATWPLWKSQLPMKRPISGSQTYKETIEYAHSLFAAEGHPHIRVAALEWNIGPGPWMTDPDHNNFKTALMQAEMQLQFLQAGLDIGMLYAFESTLVNPATDKHIINNGHPNATALWMWLFSKAAGKTVVQSSSPASGVYMITAKGDQGELVTWLLNKTDFDHTIEFNMSGYTVSDISEAWRFHDAGDGKGALMPIALWEVAGKQRTTLRADSLNMIGFNYPSNAVPNRPVIEMNHFEPIPNGLLIGWDKSSGSPDIAATGISGTLFDGSFFKVDAAAGSTDGSYGSAHTGASTGLTAFTVRTDKSKHTLAFSVVSQSSIPVRLDAVHFDYAPWWADSPKDVALIYDSGDLTNVANHTVVQTVTGLSYTGQKIGDYPDYDWTLTNLNDRILGHGETAVFNLVVSNAGAEWAEGAFDNIAVSGGTVANAPDSAVVSWRAQTAKKYTVMQASNLLSNDWNSAFDTMMGWPGDMSAPVELQQSGFYKLQIDP